MIKSAQFEVEAMSMPMSMVMKDNDTLLKVQRQAQIRKTVEDRGVVTVTELSPIFSVSEATIRRDLEECSERGWLIRTHGGTVKIDDNPPGDVVEGFEDLMIQVQRVKKRFHY
jgi:DeoR/GlpR family transcriptional regulator of sugar metabolism